jgi:hypothetical protein
MRIAFAFLFALLAVPAFAQDTDRGKRLDQGRILVDLTTADSVIGPMLDAMWPSIEMQLPGTISLEVTERLKETFGTEIKSALSDVLDEIAGLYADNFTLEELAAINKFYASGPGTKLVNTQGELMQQMLPTITARLQETLPGAIQNVVEQAEQEGLIGN